MESEADLCETQLGLSIQSRRRSASASDDYSVQRTNDDATESKMCAVKLGYWEDKFIGNFVHFSPDSSHHRRDPEISRGYWARTCAISSIVTQFIAGAGPSAQVVNMGAGFDTLYWRLKEAGLPFAKYVELDFSSVTAKKIKLIRRVARSPATPDLSSYFGQAITESQHTELHAGDYHLIGVDLRQLAEFRERLAQAGLDHNLPTIFIAECVLIYMDEVQCGNLLNEISSTFHNTSFVNYEQVNMTDAFSKVMTENLEKRGILLPGSAHCESLETQEKKFLGSAWTHVKAWTMEDVYRRFLDPAEISRIEKIEPLDEKELLSQLLQHYCLVYASKGVGDGLASLCVK